MELMLTGMHMNAQRAYQVGMVNAVVAVQDRMRVANEYACRLADSAPLVIELLETSPVSLCCRGALRNCRGSRGASCIGCRAPRTRARADAHSPRSASPDSRDADWTQDAAGNQRPCFKRG
jgi:enoyl-CoA hydratase/carnithine racemase